MEVERRKEWSPLGERPRVRRRLGALGPDRAQPPKREEALRTLPRPQNVCAYTRALLQSQSKGLHHRQGRKTESSPRLHIVTQ